MSAEHTNCLFYFRAAIRAEIAANLAAILMVDADGADGFFSAAAMSAAFILLMIFSFLGDPISHALMTRVRAALASLVLI